MSLILAGLTYFAYLFIIAMYVFKVTAYCRLPLHLRWDLYPMAPGEEGSCYENKEWWSVPRRRSRLRGILHLLAEYLHLGSYLRKEPCYWAVLYPWHVGFVLIILFHMLCFVSGVTTALGFKMGSGQGLHYGVLVMGVAGFVFGAVGGLGLAAKRFLDHNLRIYTTPLNYVSYVLTLLVFLSGLYAWYFADPAFSGYREFWRGLVTLHYVTVDPATALHITLFDLFLIYLPFTRSMHYITRFFGFFMIRWEDRPNVRGGSLEQELVRLQSGKMSWRGAHIVPGSAWIDLGQKDQEG